MACHRCRAADRLTQPNIPYEIFEPHTGGIAAVSSLKALQMKDSSSRRIRCRKNKQLSGLNSEAHGIYP